jgi:hypothetical protein
MGEGYNGWTNYETWSVALILGNDPGLEGAVRAIVDDAIENGEPSEYWTEEERKRFRVADALKDWIEEQAEEDIDLSDRVPLSYLWLQLVTAALSDVDWHEVADSYIEQLEEQDA